MIIPTGTVQVTLSVNTVEEDIVEEDEYFSATLSLLGKPDAVVICSPDVAFVTIIDERGSGLRESIIHLVTLLMSSRNAHQLSHTMLICTSYIVFFYSQP